MVYECKICKFETTILTHFNTHKATKKHIKRCEECESEPVKDVQETSKIAELEKRIMELEMQLKMKDEMIEFLKAHAQPAQVVKTHKKEPEENVEPVSNKKKTTVEPDNDEELPKTNVTDSKVIEMLKTKLKFRDGAERSDFLHKQKPKSLFVATWISNEMTKILCEGESDWKPPEVPVVKQVPVNLCPNVIEVIDKYSELRLKNEFPEGFEWIKDKGTTYVMSVDKVVYDPDTEEEIGFYNGEYIRFN